LDGWTCCPESWRRFQRSCYFLSLDTMNWAESEQNCTGMGSHLVVINSKAEQEFLFNLTKEKVTNMYETKYYIGLAAYKSGQWQWVDQTPYGNTPTFWKPGEPNLLFAEKCAAIHVKGNTDPNTYSGHLGHIPAASQNKTWMLTTPWHINFCFGKELGCASSQWACLAATGICLTLVTITGPNTDLRADFHASPQTFLILEDLPSNLDPGCCARVAVSHNSAGSVQFDRERERGERRREEKRREEKRREEKRREEKRREEKTRQDKTRQDKTRQDKTRQDKTRQDKTRQDKTRLLETWEIQQRITGTSVNSPQAKNTKVNKPTKFEERSSDCPFHCDGHVPQDTLCWYYDVNEATPEAGDGLFLTGNITGAYYHWCPFQLLGFREVIRVTPNLHLASRNRTRSQVTVPISSGYIYVSRSDSTVKGIYERSGEKESSLVHRRAQRSPDKYTDVNQRQAERVYLQTSTDHQARARYYCCVPFG
ncbi:C-type lectin domain family 4 member D, partial [Lamprotornis superbus]